MDGKIKLLDCTLRDGAYIVDSKFGTSAMTGIIGKLQEANLDIIECGWLKDSEHIKGTTFFHLPSDIEQYLDDKKDCITYVAMIDYNRYDLNNLPENNHKSIDAIRVVFPKDHYSEGISLGEIIKEKGYKVYFQAANTLGYTDYELLKMIEMINEAEPECISIVDTFGAMYSEDLVRIITLFNNNLKKGIKLGFHSHNNLQLSFSLAIKFIETLYTSEREVIVDSSLCGMGRGAGNATTELMTNYLNRKYKADYDINAIMDAIDMYMNPFIKNFEWGYSIPYYISGIYGAHVNNIAYLKKTHRTKAKDMRLIIEELLPEDRIQYDYDLLEDIYINYQDRKIDDSDAMKKLEKNFQNKNIMLLAPGKSLISSYNVVKNYIDAYNPIVIGINSMIDGYDLDYIFFNNEVRYDYARSINVDGFKAISKIITSNIKTVNSNRDEIIVNYNTLIKRGWKHFDNSMIMCLRLLAKLNVTDIAIAGFDGYFGNGAENYSDMALQTLNSDEDQKLLNEEIKEMFLDYKQTAGSNINLNFVTESIYL